jgi:hypothetical protein
VDAGAEGAAAVGGCRSANFAFDFNQSANFAFDFNQSANFAFDFNQSANFAFDFNQSANFAFYFNKGGGGGVQAHALALLHMIRQNDRLAVSKLVSSLTRGGVRAPLAQCLLIRYVSQVSAAFSVSEWSRGVFLRSGAEQQGTRGASTGAGGRSAGAEHLHRAKAGSAS